MTPPDKSDDADSAARSLIRFLGLTALYLVPVALCVIILLWVAGRQEGANAFRYVGF